MFVPMEKYLIVASLFSIFPKLCVLKLMLINGVMWCPLT